MLYSDFMNREPIGLYIFRFLVWLGIFVVLCLLYWSSALLELDMKGVQSELRDLKEEVSSLKHEISQGVITTSTSTSTSPSETQNKEKSTSARSYIDDSIPNILEEDPFYKETLPKMLGADFKPHGTLQSATIGKPDNLHPFSNWGPVMGWVNLCNVAVARQKFGKYETFAPDMALKMELRKNASTGKPEFWVHLRDNVFWKPLKDELFSEDIHLAPHFSQKHQVTAHDFKFYLDAVMNPYMQETGAVALRTYLGDIEEIEVLDNLTFIVRWKTKPIIEDGKDVQKLKYIAKLWTGALRPLASFVYKYFPDGSKIVEDDSNPDTYRTNSLWAQNFMQHWAKNIIVSCGPWIFEGMTDRMIKFRRNPDHYNPYEVLVSEMEEEFKQSPEVIWQDFKGAKVDTYSLQPDQLIEYETFLHSDQYLKQVEEKLAIKRLDYVVRRYDYIGFNLAKEMFKSKKVRQAITMAVDRARIIKQNLNGMGIEITGTFFRYSPAYDTSIPPWPFDLQRARQLLAEEGWYDSDGDGIIDKMIDGKRTPFRFTLTYYVKNPLTKSVCEYVATALKEIGIECSLNGVDMADLSAVVEDKSFDTYFLAWGLGSPPEDPKQIWYSAGAKEKGSSNIIGFANAEVDEIIEKLEYEYDPAKRLELYHRFDRIIYDEAPYIFLYTMKTAMTYREYLQNVFIPADRQDLVPGANVAEPDSSIFWIKK